MAVKNLYVVDAGHFKLDGGAMFGVVPRSMWEKMNPPDDKNMCDWALRCLLVETDERLILIDTGMGDKQDAKFRSFFYPSGKELVASIREVGFSPEDITDVWLTHLHFDHDGGAVKYDENGQLVPTFPNARYWSNQKHWEWAKYPNAREKASFLKENFIPLEEQNKIHFIPETLTGQTPFGPDIKVFFSYGHTEAMMVPIIHTEYGTLVYCADLLPSRFHIGMPYVMCYDIRPLTTLDEKTAFFNEALSGQYTLFLEHDPTVECITLTKNDRGRVVLDKTLTLDDFMGR